MLITNETVEVVQIQVGMDGKVRAQQKGTSEPSLTPKMSAKVESALAMTSTRQSNTFSAELLDTSGKLQVPKDADASAIAIASNPKVQDFFAQAMHRSVDEMLASGILQQVLLSAMRQPSSFETGYSGSFDPDGFDMHKEQPSSTAAGGHVDTDTPNRPPRLGRSKTCHQKTSMGVMFGSIWVRTTTLKAAEGCDVSRGDLEFINSIIFYPSSWLNRLGLRYGTEATLQWSGTAGWKFNIKPIKAVPESAYIFRMCKQGNIGAVHELFSSGDASLVDTSPKGWTPLHVGSPNSPIRPRHVAGGVLHPSRKRQRLTINQILPSVRSSTWTRRTLLIPDR